MKYRAPFFFFLAVISAVVAVIAYTLISHPVPVFQPKGIIAMEERSLMINAVLLMLIVIIPVFILAFFVAWHYRASNTKATYEPNWEHSKADELVWWAIPFEIILVLAAMTWSSSHALDPSVPLQSTTTPMTIEVVALNWKWLFIYPEEHIASVNFVEFPAATPINFRITADAPMNSFWIPALGGQIYAMTGMVTPLHLEAYAPGDFKGASSNFSGDGFEGMKFTARAVSNADFDEWVASVRSATSTLDQSTYVKLAATSTNNPIQYFGSVSDDLYSKILGKFMPPPGSDMHMNGNGNMNMPGGGM
jgi:cytochrome o ubiquinol oxidase subunit 2